MSFFQVIKTVSQRYQATPEVLALLAEFKRMVNVCISVGIEENISSLKALSLKAYPRLSREILGYYRLCAISTCTGILRNYRRAKRRDPKTRIPCARRLRLTTCYGFKIQNGLLRLPIKPRQFAYIQLNRYTLKVLSQVKTRSVTLTAEQVSISFSKETAEIQPEGYIGVDLNLDNATTASASGIVHAYDLSKATKIKSMYRTVASRFTRNDSRIAKSVYGKYGRKERNHVQPLLHDASKRIVEDAKSRGTE